MWLQDAECGVYLSCHSDLDADGQLQLVQDTSII